jgi:2-oxoglutarate ferredoxin oxidoreductase subunit beta
MTTPASLPLFAAHELTTDQEVRWCPGCGDFAILATLKNVLAGLGVPRERLVFFSGIGCAGRLPYYLNTYGFHGIHGCAPALATGLKLANPELQVWIVTGDGDALSAGSNHLLHALRRNVDVKILVFNNEVLGLTKGQYSATSRLGTRTRTSPDGSLETPLRPIAVALAGEASFAARTIDVDVNHLTSVLRRAAAHRGAAFVEIYQNCKIFNDGVFDYATDLAAKADATLHLEHGQPLLFGKERNRGLRLNAAGDVEIVNLGNGRHDGLLLHDEARAEPDRAFLLSRLAGPDFPECFGVFRAVERPTFDGQITGLVKERRARSPGNLAALLEGDAAWTVE